MSAWLHLRQDIVWEFYEQALLGRERRDVAALILANEEYWRRWHRNHPKNEKRKFVSKVRRRERRRLLRQAIGPCVVCGKAVADGVRGWLRKYCSDTCKGRSEAERRKARRHEMAQADLARRACEMCSGPLVGLSKRRRFCTIKCQNDHRNRGVAEARRLLRTSNKNVPAMCPPPCSQPDDASHADP